MREEIFNLCDVCDDDDDCNSCEFVAQDILIDEDFAEALEDAAEEID